MPWLSLTVELDAAAAEPFSDALLDAGALTVSLEEAAPGWRLQRVSALFPVDARGEQLLDAAANACGISVPRVVASQLEDRDWVRESQAQFEPFSLGDRLWIGPTWMTPPSTTLTAVHLDPGLAFGTGSHASTRLVLRYLAANIRGGERVLDYGCGSGILAIAAAKLGAAAVDAVDIDPVAVETAQANARINGARVNCLEAEALAPALYDVVAANILAQPLIVLAPLLASRSRPGGHIALSGVLESQAAEVSAAYSGHYEIGIADTWDGWALVAGTRR